MATITYTATSPAGETVTRTSGTMHYTHANLSHGSWHLTEAAAMAKGGVVVPAVPTAINGKFEVEWLEDFATIPGYSYPALVAAYQAKVMAKVAKKAPQVKVTLAEKIEAVEAPATGGLQWGRAKDGTPTAKGANRTYRLRKAETVPGLWFAEQRGTGSWTPIAGACATQRQAESLAQRYENGERQLSHKSLRGVAYNQLPAAS